MRVQLKVNDADTQGKGRQQTLCGLAPVSLRWKFQIASDAPYSDVIQLPS